MVSLEELGCTPNCAESELREELGKEGWTADQVWANPTVDSGSPCQGYAVSLGHISSYNHHGRDGTDSALCK